MGFLASPAAAALNHLLDREAWAREKLAPFDGEIVELHLPPLPALRMAIAAGGRAAPADAAGQATLVITARPGFLAALAKGGEQLMGAVTISGNARLASEILALLRYLRWDLEEDLSRVLGDALAHRVCGAARDFVAWQAQSGRRLAENVMITLPVFVLLFIPVLLGSHTLFHHWLEPGPEDHAILGKAAYLNWNFFLVRAAIYFAAWTGLALWFYRQSVQQDASGDPRFSARMRSFSAPSIAIFALTITFAAFDWIMSLEPHWFSTMFGVIYFAGSLVAVYAVLAVVTLAMNSTGLLNDVVTVEHRHDIGKLLFAFTVFWTYVSFSQYFLIWYADLPEENFWYDLRMTGSWQQISTLLCVGHFGFPFLFLMSRHVKRHKAGLLFGALWLLVMHFFDLHWQIMPNLHKDGFHFHLLDATTLVGVGGVFIAAFGWMLQRQALIPTRDPRLPESLTFENM